MLWASFLKALTGKKIRVHGNMDGGKYRQAPGTKLLYTAEDLRLGWRITTLNIQPEPQWNGLYHIYGL